MAYNITIEEVLNSVTVSQSAAPEISVNTTNYPITVSYNATVIEGGGISVNGVPAGGTTGQILAKVNNTNYNMQWIPVPVTGLQDIVQDTSPQLGAALDTNGYSITSAGNADVSIKANGTGEINLESQVNVGTGTGPGLIFARGGNDLTLLSDPLNLAGQAALSLKVNGDVEFGPGPGGRVLNDAQLTVFGNSLATAELTSNGARNIELSTNQGLDSGKITIVAGINNNINIEPSGTGDVLLTADTVRVGDSATTAIVTSNGANALRLTTNGGVNAPFFQVNHTADSITLRDSTLTNQIIVNAPDTGVEILGDGIVIASNQRANIIVDGATNGAITLTANGTGNILLQGGSGTGGTITVGGTSNSNIVIAPQGTGDVQLNADAVRIGDNGAAASLTTWGAGSLTISTNSGSTSGTIVIAAGANGNISLTPNGTGSVVLDGVNWPQADGASNQVLRTNGSGQLSWANVNSLGLSVGITDIVEDTTPQLGGDLDVDVYKIVSNAGDIKIAPTGQGKVKLSNIAYPNQDGSAGQVLRTDGSGSLGWADKQDPTIVNESQPQVQSTGQHWYRPNTGAFYTARNGSWDAINDDGFF